MAYMGALLNWWPKICRRFYHEGWAQFSALTIFVGFNLTLTFFPQFRLGYLGMPRRYHLRRSVMGDSSANSAAGLAAVHKYVG